MMTYFFCCGVTYIRIENKRNSLAIRSKMENYLAEKRKRMEETQNLNGLFRFKIEE